MKGVFKMKNFIIALIFSVLLVIGAHGQYATPVNTTLDVILIIALTAGFKALIDSEEGKF
jgi:hypothetical protein